jgi:GNAT superfamily N-acetyltransferase
VPLTRGRWDDFVELFTRPGTRGGAGPGTSGCWCMWWRGRTRSNEGNRAGMEELVRRGTKPGLVAYDGDRPVGWISIAPRESYGQLMRSRDYGPRDGNEGVWSIVCIYVHATERHRGIADVLLEHAVDYAFLQGAAAVDAYPQSQAPRKDYMGSVSAYKRLGFKPVRKASVRTIMRVSRPSDR